jgi:hypothetical protein
VLEIDTNPRPCPEASSHRIDEHVSRREVLRRFRMPLLPTVETRECIFLPLRACDLDERPRWRAAA